MNIRETLFRYAETEYRDFQAKLMPTVPKDKILGVRTPILRKLAKELCGSEEADSFIKTLPHKYYEEDNLHSFLIEKIKDFDRCLFEVERFLPYIDNWATCDCMSPAVFKKNRDEILHAADRWLESTHIYTVRYGIGVYMKYFLDENFKEEYLKKIAKSESDEYYINMMRAWYFATALAKQYDATIPYIENRLLDEWTHRKTIQKASESYRISPEKKEHLRNLK